MSQVSHDLTSGSIIKKFILFTIPIIGVNLLQAVYNFTDMVIVGQLSGTNAMSAVSIGGQVTHIVLMTCMGLANGTSVFVGQLTGAGRKNEIKQYIGSMLTFIILLGAIITGILTFFCKPLLLALNTQEEIFSQTTEYMIICLSGTIFIYTYNVLAAALRGIGESMIPLIIIIITTVENIVLDIIFVGPCRMDARGAAIATVLSQLTGMIMVIWAVKNKTELFDFKRESFRVCKDKLTSMVKVGLPQSIQFIGTNISFLCILALVNTFGVDATAAAGAASKIGTFGTLPGMACMTALISTTAQNIPKKNYSGIMRTLACGIVLSLVCAGVFVVLCHVFPAEIYGIFNDSEGVRMYGIDYLKLYSYSFLTEVVMFCLFGVLGGAGYTNVTMICAISQAFLVRLLFAWIFAKCTPLGFSGIGLAYGCAPLVGITISILFLSTGKWKKSRV